MKSRISALRFSFEDEEVARLALNNRRTLLIWTVIVSGAVTFFSMMFFEGRHWLEYIPIGFLALGLSAAGLLFATCDWRSRATQEKCERG